MIAAIRATFDRILNALQPSAEDIQQATPPVLMAVGILYLMLLLFRQDWLTVVLFLPGFAVLVGVSVSDGIKARLIGGPFTLRHALYIVLYWFFSAIWVLLLGILLQTPAAGKESQLFYIALIAWLQFTWAAGRSLIIAAWPWAHRTFSTRIPLWEQVLIAINETLAIGLMAYVWGTVSVQIFQPFVFTLQINWPYAVGMGLATFIYWVLVQLMWTQATNEWLSQNRVWVVLARILSPFVLVVTTLLIANRFTEQTDPRTASLLDSRDIDLTVLGLFPVIWLLVVVVMGLVFTSRSSLRELFLPETLLNLMPARAQRILRAISDMDLLLVVGVLTTTIPVYLLFLGSEGGIVSTARQLILQRGSALVETSEQALAILFVLPFYLFILLILLLYAVVISRPAMPARIRDSLMKRLPFGFLITLIITLYLFAVPFTQVFSESRLPTLPRDLGRILSFYVFVPLLLLYLHFYLLVRFPYGRGQRLWREREAVALEKELNTIDRRITNLNQEITRMDQRWQMAPRSDEPAALRGRMDTLHRYIHLNGERDNLNMERLRIVASRQQLAEISETPLSVAVARMPVRVISVGIPLLLLFQLYQWAVLNEGLREVVNNPNITVSDFIRILLDNIEF